jgi:hypothetical protein
MTTSMSTTTSTEISNEKPASSTSTCHCKSEMAPTDVSTLKLLILFLLGNCGMIFAFLLGRTWSPQIRQLLLGIDGSETVSSTSSVERDFADTFPPSHRSRKVSSISDIGDAISKDDQSNTCNNVQGTSTSNIGPRKRFHELLVHPIMLNLHPPPQSVILVLWTNKQTHALVDTMFDEMQREMSSLLDEIFKHKSVTDVYIAAEDPITLQSCHAIVSTIHMKRPISLHCTSMNKLAKDSATVDTVILPSWPQPQKDDEDEEYDDEEGFDMMQFWYDRLSSHGALATVLGTTYSLQHIVAREKILHKRWLILKYLMASFPRIIDYDIPASYYFYYDTTPSSKQQSSQIRSKFPINIAVAFKSNDGLAYWRMNEAHYSLAIQEHLTEDSLDKLDVFDSATMLQLQYPPSHSSWYYCDSYAIPNGCDFHGYDPEYPNIPLTDLYVAKSKAGEYAGRGVFTNVDIPASSNIALEATTQSIHYEWKTTGLHRAMMEQVTEYTKGKGKIVSLYAEAYGYANDP